MAKRRRGEQRPFRPEILEPFADPHLLPRLLPGRRIWRYRLTVPIEQIKPAREPKATPRDRNLMRRMFVPVQRLVSSTPLPSVVTALAVRRPRPRHAVPRLATHARKLRQAGAEMPAEKDRDGRSSE